MAISLVEMQGSIPRQHDFQIQKQNEDTKVIVDQNNYQVQGEKNVNQSLTKVKQQDDTRFSNEDSDRNKDAYQGDGGRKRKKQEDGVVVKKAKGGFDIKI